MIYLVINYRIDRQLDSLDLIFSNPLVIILKGSCFYILVLDLSSFNIKRTIISLLKPKLYPSILSKPVFTNFDNFWNIYLRNYSPKSFPTFDLYQLWLILSSNKINIINMTRFQMFNLKLVVLSSSETKNILTIIDWYKANRRVFLNYPKLQVNIYNFFNFTLFQLSKRSLGLSLTHKSKHFRNINTPQLLTIDIHDNRSLNVEGNINYYNLSTLSVLKWKGFKASNKGRLLYKIDFSASYMQLLVKILLIEMDPLRDIYLILKEQLQLPEDMLRVKVKQEVFSILFSNKILLHLDILFFKMCYYFSKVLLLDYRRQGYILALISKKKIRLDSEKINRSKLFNSFIMSLETLLYIGILYNMLQFDRLKISPKLFIYDSIIFLIDVPWVVLNMDKILNVLTFEGALKITRQIGRNLTSFENI